MAEWVAMIVNPNGKVRYEWDSGGHHMPEPKSWDFEKGWGVSPTEFSAMFQAAVKAGYIWRKGEPRDGAQRAMWTLNDLGFYIRIVTKRLVHKTNHALVQQSTSEWLDYWNIPYHEIVYMGNHTSKGDFRCDIALDDNPDHIREYLDAGVAMPLLMQRPWNAKSNLRDIIGYSVHSFNEFEAAVSSFIEHADSDYGTQSETVV